jgi:hypothetical protein
MLCGGRLGYLYRSPASCKRQQKRTQHSIFKRSSKMSWVLRDLDRRVTGNCTSKLQTCPLVREGALRHEDRKCRAVIEIWSWATHGGLTVTVGPKITWTTFTFLFQGSFYLLGYGLILSVFVFIWEIFICRYLCGNLALGNGLVTLTMSQAPVTPSLRTEVTH